MTGLAGLIDRAPEIIRAAAQSNLGILALCCLGLGVLAFLFFHKSRTEIRIGIFILLFTGVSGFAVAVFRVPNAEASEVVIPPYASEFGPVHLANDSFEKVRNLFAQELPRIRVSSRGEIRSKRVEELVDHYVQSRRNYYEAFRQDFTHQGSATKGSSGGHKRAPLSASCAKDMTIVQDSVSVSGVGGCYGGEITTTSATGTVSQTGEGRSACTLKITCQFTPNYIDSIISSEKAALHNLALE